MSHRTTSPSDDYPGEPAPVAPTGEPSPDRLLRWVMIAVAVWGGMLALGTFLFGLDAETGKPAFRPNPFRGLIVLCVVGTFLGVWSLALRSRQRRISKK
jgi:hypothetical protein